MKRIIQNEAQCKKCNDIIWSGNRLDYTTCSCGAISVDGGMDYIRRRGNPEDMDERSMSMESTDLAYAVEAVKEMRESGRTDLGMVLGVIRSLRDSALLDMEKFTSTDK